MDRSFPDLLARLDRISGLPADVRQKFRLAVSIVDHDAELSATRAHTILEYVVHTVHTKKINKPGTRPLEDLLQNIVKSGDVRRRSTVMRR